MNKPIYLKDSIIKCLTTNSQNFNNSIQFERSLLVAIHRNIGKIDFIEKLQAFFKNKNICNEKINKLIMNWWLGNVTLVSSNKNKIEEFKKHVPELIIKSGLDRKEVFGTMNEVIIHKSKDSGEGYLVEDTILLINGEEVVDIKWKIEELKEGDKASWIVSLGYNSGNYIYIVRGIIEGYITLKKEIKNGFGFDPYFIPINCKEKLSLMELDQKGMKDKYSARKIALENFKKMKFDINPIKVSSIPNWTGKYQND